MVGKHEGKKPLGRPRHRSVDDIKTYLQEMGWGHGLDWSSSKQEQMAVLCTSRCSKEPVGTIKCQEFLK
jgi:hypothetical protein